MKLYNSLNKKVEEFIPYGDIVKMYSCGPTVYYYPHIGNMRSYIFMDSLRRTLKYANYKIEGVMNITDVGHLTSDADTGEDKMEVASKRENKTPLEIAEYYTNIFMDNASKLNIDMPEHITKATEYIPKMIEFIKKLEEKGYTYMTKDGLYFDTMEFKGYGKLSNKDMTEKGVARIEENDEKKHPFDFALWKFVEPNHIMKWDSPWGVGCPGWHIECSVMSTDILGEHIDIHTGGIDHKTVHHENEIAQNDACMGHEVVKCWMHCAFLQVDGGKMSKSLNNIYTIEDLEKKGYSPMDFKYFVLNTHYSKPLNFTFDSISASKSARNKLMRQLLVHKDSTNKTDENVLNDYRNKFNEAIENDLNTPLAIGVIWTMLKENPSIDIYNLIIEFDKALGLKLDEVVEEIKEEIPDYIQELAIKRAEAKKNKDFTLADSLRNEITSKGYSVLDTREGYTIEKIN